MFENGTQSYQTLDSGAVLRAASILFCQRELQQLNETEEKQQKYFDRLRRPPTEHTADTSSSDNSSYVYDTSTSEWICIFF